MTLLPNSSLFPTPPDSFKNWQQMPPGGLAVSLAELATTQPLLVITPNTASARSLRYALRFYLSGKKLPVQLFPDWETLPYDRFSPHRDITSERIRILHELGTQENGVIIAPVNTLMQRLAPASHLHGNYFQFQKGDTFDLSAQRRRLVEAGYHQRDNVFEHGEFAVRGAIVDIFPTGAEHPLRIELFDDEIESLRHFDPENQRSTGTIDHFSLLPAAEYPLSDAGIRQFRQSFRSYFDIDTRQSPLYQDVSDGIATPGLEYYLPLFFETLSSLFDYLPNNIKLVEMDGCTSAANTFWQELRERYDNLHGDITRPLLPPTDIYLPVDSLNQQLNRFGRARLCDKGVVFPFQPLPLPANDGQGEAPFQSLAALLSEKTKLSVLLCAESAGRREALLTLLQKRGLQPDLIEDWQEWQASPHHFGLTIGTMDQGFYAPEQQLLVIAESELYGDHIMQRRRRKKKQDNSENVFHSLGELTEGTAVVHIEHGIGRYHGLVTMPVDDQKQEFLLLEYADNAKLYVPVTSLHLISRYGAGDQANAPLTRLGSSQWSKARHKAAEKIRDTAAEILNTQARRDLREGRRFSLDADEYQRFANAFPFEETPDQTQAIEAVLADMQGKGSMDRLICGDVGFGKTEVAMRAAFVAIQNNTQVAILVPTTLLAQQHFSTFQDRFANLAVNVEVLSRFRTAKEKTQILADAKAGKIDILIGTHRLLQKDMEFGRLGLVIVDEEHRFGVRHKERLKQLRAECDLLTLTATPIPRTLNMALSSMRDISIIATPPDKRLSVQTFVQRKNEGVVKEAILRELLRGGQVYYLHNDIASMEKAVDDLKRLLPDARIAHAHGQMHERELEHIMSDFYHRRFNVLVCSTIIETGIDIPSANTIIIERADRFGLAQLHQLRGRVGRSHHQAYAYLLTPGPRAMSADAKKRLEAISKTSDLGAGFLLASQDLEIRGAGELLGEDQHGHIESIGFSLYMAMLEETVDALKKGEQPDMENPLSSGPEINLQIAALIPDDYLPDVVTRLALYKRIATTKSGEQLDELQVEMIDRFGLLPNQVKNLFANTLLRHRAEQLGITRIDAGNEKTRISFSDKTCVNPLSLVQLVQSNPNRYRLEGSNQLHVTMETAATMERIEAVDTLLDKLA